MKRVGIISRWNATCGVSMHAELIGNEIRSMGYDLTIFAPYIVSANKWWHHKIIRGDESFVVRCYTEDDPNGQLLGKIDEEKILQNKPDALIVESYEVLPHSQVEKLVKKLDIPTIAVIHEGARKDIRYTDLRIFDKIVVFDRRYVDEMLTDVEDKVEVIHYPCHPVVENNRKFAEDQLTFFSFGRQPAKEYNDYLAVLERLTDRYDFVYKVIRSDGALPVTKPWLKQEQKRLENSELYTELTNSDIHLLPKGRTERVVVSSTLCQCLGSLTPTVVPATRHFERLGTDVPVVAYNDLEDLEEKIITLIEDADYRARIRDYARKYVEKYNSKKIANEFIKLLKSV